MEKDIGKIKKNDTTDIIVRIDEYKDVLEVIELMRNKIEQAKSILSRINDLKNEEDAEIESWKISIEAIEQKIDNVDSSLLEPEQS